MTPRPRAARQWSCVPGCNLLGGAVRGVTLLAPLILLAACGHSAPTQFYALDSHGPATPLGLVATADPVRVLAVRVPPELDRLEVVREVAGGTVQVDDLNRWSAPLGDLARKALLEDLADRLPGVDVLPARANASDKMRDLTVEILSLRRQEMGFELRALLEVADAATGRNLNSQSVRLFVASSGSDAAAEAKAFSSLLAKLADVISPSLAMPTAGSKKVD
jgi:uncharacterized lipoprotein YmbA